MIDRYINRTIMKNGNSMYDNTFLERNVKFINQYETPTFIYPNSKNIGKIKIEQHIWATGDRYYKLADKFYGSPQDWWIIAKFNNKPTESHVSIGDIILIPGPLYEIMTIMKG